MPDSTDLSPDQSWRPTPSVLAKIADELRHNDECGSRDPLTDEEYMDDARALFRIFTDHKADERDRLRVENERLRAAFADLLEEAKDMRAYVPEYFAKKWHHDEALAAAQTALAFDETEESR